jgi:hypothetical protein
MERVGRRKLLPILSMLLGILVIGFVIPGQDPMISHSMGGTLPSRSASQTRERHATRKVGSVRLVSETVTESPLHVRQDVSASKRSDKEHSAPKQSQNDEAGSGVAVAADALRARTDSAAPRTRQEVDLHHADRTRVANRLPDSQPLPSRPKVAVAPQPVFVAQWPLAKSLIAVLSDPENDDTGGDLATKCIEQLERLHRIESLDSPQCADVFDQLKWLKENADTLAKNANSPTSAAALHRVAYAIQRRVEIWEQIHLIANQKFEISTTTGAVTQNWEVIVKGLESELRSIKKPQAWQEYLLLDDLRTAFLGIEASAADRRVVAQRILRRVSNPTLTTAQRDFLDRPAFKQLLSELVSWASEPVDYASVMRQLEAYESIGTVIGGDRVVAAQRALFISPNEEAKELARRLDVHYRNANLRIAVSGDLVNRLLPEEQQMRERIRERFQGADVHGDSFVTNRVRVRLQTDRNRWRVGIESSGEGNSETQAERGPVVFENRGRFRVDVRKMLFVDRRGVRTMRAEAAAQSDHEVTGLSTDFDKVPVVSAIVRSLAMNQQANGARDAELQVNRKLEALASRRMDDEVQRQLKLAEAKFESEWVEPIRRLGLDPRPMQMQSTSERLIARYRLASGTQLAAFTPRPMALADSWFSMQIHESTLNNVIGQLELDGASLELTELYRKIGEKLGRDTKIPEDLPEDVTIQFADHDAVKLVCDGGKIRVTLRIAKLAAGQTSWRGFTVQVNYVVDANGLEIKAKRDSSADDYIAVNGVRRLGNRIAIATIFSKVFASDREFPLLPEKLASDERLKDLAVRQLLVDNGWIGISLVPENIEYTVDADARNVPPGFLR